MGTFYDNLYYLVEIKVQETEDAIKNGADEIDMVIAIGKMKSGEYDYIRNEIHNVHEVCQRNNRLLKVIIEIYPFLLECLLFS